MKMRRAFPYLALTFAVALASVVLLRPVPDSFQDAGDGIALGPARETRPGPKDLLARLATGAASMAAGEAGGPVLVAEPPEELPDELALLMQTNQARAEAGLGELYFDPELLAVARARAGAQIGTQGLSHYNALGELAFVSLLGEVGVPYSLAGENLARSSRADPTVVDRLHQALMNSPTHRANILHPAFGSLAIGSAQDPAGQIAFAQIFRAGD